MKVREIVRAAARRAVPLKVRTFVWEAKNRGSAKTQIERTWDDRLDDDVFLASYPRSGNTWLRNVVTNLRFPDAEWDLYSLSFAFPEEGSSVDPFSAPRPRWIKTHAGYNAEYRRSVYVVRDGRDVAVSFYHWSGADSSMPFEEFVRGRILIATPGLPAWHEHVLGWSGRASGEVMIVRYEDLLANGTNEFHRLCHFFGIERTDAQIEVALGKSTYKKQQRDFDRHHVLSGKKVGVQAGPGKWREYFDNALLEEFWSVAGEAMERCGYKR